MADAARSRPDPKSGPDAPPTVEMSERPAARNRSDAASTPAPAGGPALTRSEDRRETTVEVDAVVAVPDGLIEARQGVRLLVDPLRGERQPAIDELEHGRRSSA
jgi:hypothetical protein